MGFAGGATATLIERSSYVKDFWSDVDDVIDLPGALDLEPAADKDLPDIIVSGLPSGITLTRVVLLLKVRAIENTSATGANAVRAEAPAYPELYQTIKVLKVINGEDWGDAITAINMVDNMWTVAVSTREAGDVVIGDNDIKAKVSGNGTYNVCWIDALVDYTNLMLNDIQVGFRMFWEVE